VSMGWGSPAFFLSRSLSARPRGGLTRGGAAACVLALFTATGCGGGGKPEAKFTGSTTTPTRTAPSPAHPKPAPATQPSPRTSPTSAENQPGGAGDEQPARVPALFTGRAGRISPHAVHVPPYIAVLVQLRSADGRGYGLRFAEVVVRTGAGRRVGSARLDGLRPGRAVSGAPLGGGNPVRIVADAEPGP
jgi:hypothetical protein